MDRGWRRFAIASAAAIAVSACFYSVLALRPFSETWISWVESAGEVAAAFVATAACGWAARRTAGRLRVAWMLLALSALSWGTGEAALGVFEIGLGVVLPIPSGVDAGFLLAIPLAGAGILIFAERPRNASERLRLTLDGCVVLLSLIVTMWILSLHAVWNDVDPAGERFIDLAYPVGNTLIATVLILVIRRATRRQRGRMLLLLAGLATDLVANAVFSASVAAGQSNLLTSMVEAGSAAGYLMIALAALWPSGRTDAEPRMAPIDLWQTALPWLALGAAAESVAVLAFQGGALDPFLGVAIGVIGVVLVTNQVIANREFLAMIVTSRRGEATMAEVIGRSPIGIVRAGPDFRIIDANPVVSAMFFEPHGTIVGSAIAKYIPVEAQQKAFDDFAGLISGAVDTIDTESPAIRADGTRFWVRMTCTVVPTPADQVDYFVVTLQDASAKHVVEEAAVQSLAVLERLNRLKSEFLQSVSHEFKTALMGIQGFSELMRDSEDLDVKDVRTFAADIYRDAARLDRLVGEMMDLDRVEDGHAGLRLGVVDINDLIRRVVSDVQVSAPDTSLAVLLDPRLAPAKGDAEKLSGVLRTLLESAVKYTPDGGQITVCSRMAGADVEVGVRDEGMGVRADFDNRLFGRNDLYADNPIRKVVATGLGLGIVRQVIEMHGGRIWVEQLDLKGSEFHFTIPAASAVKVA